jgi:hypothetical protein
MRARRPFLARIRAEEGSAAGPGHADLRAALPDLQRHLLHSAAHAPGQRYPEHCGGPRPPRRSFPFRGLYRSEAGAHKPRPPLRPHGDRGRPRRLPGPRLRIRARGHLHALRLPHDPDHDVVFHGQRGGVAQASPSASGSSCCSSGLGLISTLLLGSRRHRAAGRQSLGERLHRAGVLRLRAEPAGRVRDHHSFEHADAN